MVNIWWVNQPRTYAEDVEDCGNPGKIAAVTRSRNGSRLSHHDRVMEMRQGDIIISNVKGKVVSVGHVIDNQSHINQNHYWKVTDATAPAYEVNVVYYKLDPSVSSKIFREKVQKLKIQEGPINSLGLTQQGYVFRFRQDGLNIIKESQPETQWPEWCP
jgi:hypothetical protein